MLRRCLMTIPFLPLLLLAGCATTPLGSTVRDLKPVTGTVTIRKVGEPMLVRGRLTTIPGFRIRADHYLPRAGEILLPLARKGDLWSCIGKTGDGSLVCLFPSSVQDRMIRADGARLAGEYSLVFRPWGEVVGVMLPEGGVIPFDEPQKLAGFFEGVEIPLPGTHKEEIIYDGRFDDMIKITYQEYDRDLSHPSYFTGFSYQIGSLGTVTVKDTVIEVLAADDREIRFIVRN
ncbi:MAG: hypothetical protein Fur0034_13830 [Desulfuromonadia bacterium]